MEGVQLDRCENTGTQFTITNKLHAFKHLKHVDNMTPTCLFQSQSVEAAQRLNPLHKRLNRV